MMWQTASGTPHSIASATPVNGWRSNSPRLLCRVLPSTFSYSSSLPTSARIAPAITVSWSIDSALPMNSIMLSAALRAMCTTQRLCSIKVVGQFGTNSVNGMQLRSSGVSGLSSSARCQALVTCWRSSGDCIHSISGHNFRTASRIRCLQTFYYSTEDEPAAMTRVTGPWGASTGPPSNQTGDSGLRRWPSLTQGTTVYYIWKNVMEAHGVCHHQQGPGDHSQGGPRASSLETGRPGQVLRASRRQRGPVAQNSRLPFAWHAEIPPDQTGNATRDGPSHC